MKVLGSIDQGTSSTRFILFSVEDGSIVHSHQVNVKSEHQRPGWCEQDPLHILSTVLVCMATVMSTLPCPVTLVSIGITNQRETTVAWSRATGLPLSNAIVWLDTRTSGIVKDILLEISSASSPAASVTMDSGSSAEESAKDSHSKNPKNAYRHICGLPVTTYFSALKMKWLLDNVPAVKEAALKQDLMFGTIDTWLLYKLTNHAAYQTDVTNASRTMLLDLKTLQWSQDMLRVFGIRQDWLPQIKSSAELFGVVSGLEGGLLEGVEITGVLGDQQSSLVGQKCFLQGHAKNTYGTGCFLLFNTGQKPVASTAGLLTTLAFKLGPTAPPYYAIEGSIAIAGAAITWLRDNLGLIKDAQELEELAKGVKDSGGVHFVPALTGLFAPHWRSDARGFISGLSQYTTKHHIARATFEAISFQTRELLESMHSDSYVPLSSLKVDGGMSNSGLMMQIQSDILGINVERDAGGMREGTAFGAAIAAGIGSGLFEVTVEGKLVRANTKDEIFKNEVETFTPKIISKEKRDEMFSEWKTAIQRCLWVENKDEQETAD